MKVAHCGKLHPRNLTWNLKIMVSKRTFLFQELVFRFHVNFWGCTITFDKEASSIPQKVAEDGDVIQETSFPGTSQLMFQKT